MRKLFLLFLMIVFILTSVGCAPNYMVSKEPCIDVRGVVPSPGKSALVVGRTTSFGGGVNIENYLDKKFIGTTKGRSFFVSSAEPGLHYVTAQAENRETVLLNFEPDKTYYLLNAIRMGVLFARTKYYLMDAQQFYNDMDGTCNFYETDKSGPGDDLTDEIFKQIVEDYKKEQGGSPLNQAIKYQVQVPTESK
jgi:hypothetical protein